MPPIVEELLAIDGCQGRKGRFLQGHKLWETVNAPAGGPTPMYIQVALKGFRDAFKGARQSSREGRGRGQIRNCWREEGNFDQNALNMYIKL